MPSKSKPQPAPPAERTQPRPYREVLEERRARAAQKDTEPLPQGEFLPEPIEDEE